MCATRTRTRGHGAHDMLAGLLPCRLLCQCVLVEGLPRRRIDPLLPVAHFGGVVGVFSRLCEGPSDCNHHNTHPPSYRFCIVNTGSLLQGVRTWLISCRQHGAQTWRRSWRRPSASAQRRQRCPWAVVSCVCVCVCVCARSVSGRVSTQHAVGLSSLSLSSLSRWENPTEPFPSPERTLAAAFALALVLFCSLAALCQGEGGRGTGRGSSETHAYGVVKAHHIGHAPESLLALSKADLVRLVAELAELVLSHTLWSTEKSPRADECERCDNRRMCELAKHRHSFPPPRAECVHAYLDGALELLRAARALLGSLLCDALAVLAAVEDGPGDLAGVLLLVEEGLVLRVDEVEDLACDTRARHD